jgi:hypothetical protein
VLITTVVDVYTTAAAKSLVLVDADVAVTVFFVIPN